MEYYIKIVLRIKLQIVQSSDTISNIVIIPEESMNNSTFKIHYLILLCTLLFLFLAIKKTTFS